jgi:hypothetical protein
VSKKYRVTFFGITADPGIFRQNMAKLGVSGSTLDKYIEKAPVVLKRDLTLADARRYAEAIMNAGGLVNIQETGEFPESKSPPERSIISSDQDFSLCPNCGFKQKKGDFCVRCGWDFSQSTTL